MPQAIVFVVNYLAVAGAISVATAVAIGTFVATYGAAILLIGGLAYSSSKARQAKEDARNAYNAAQVDRLTNVSSTIAPRELVMGRVRKGGAVFYKASTGAYQQDMYLAIALAGHEIDAVEQIYLNDQLVTLDGAGNVIEAPYGSTRRVTAGIQVIAGTTYNLPESYVPGSFGAYKRKGFDFFAKPILVPSSSSVSGLVATVEAGAGANYQYYVSESAVQITKHLGAPGQVADPSLRAAFPADWSASNTVEGVAYLVVRLRYSETAFPNGAPNVTAVIRGAKLYDPRNGLTAWTENPALMLRHVYQHPKFGKATITAAEDARLAVAANACDTSTSFSGAAAVALYRASLVLPFGTAPRSGFDDLAQAMGGSWAFAGGELYCKAGVYTAPVMSLGDADLAVIQRDGAAETQRPIAISVHKERAQKFNTVKAKIWDQGQDYKEVSLTPLTGAELLARDGAELVQEVTFPAIGHAPQALHVAGVMMRDARDALAIELPFNLRSYPLELFDNVSLTLSRYGWVGKTFSILGRNWNSDGTLQLSLKETSASITQVDASFPAQGFASNTNLPKPWIVADVGALTITSGTSELVVQQDGTVQSRMRVSWTQIVDAAVLQTGQIEVQYRLASSDGAWASLLVPGDETQVVTSDVEDGRIYIIRARAKTRLAVSDWGFQISHQVIGKTEPPATVTGLAYVQTDSVIRFTFNAPPDADYARTEFRVGASWLTGLAVPSSWVLPSAGAYTVWARHFDTSGNQSLDGPSLAVTVIAPSAPLVTYAIAGPDEILTWTQPATGFALDRYEIRTGATWATGVFVTSTKATSHRQKVTYSGPRQYWVAAIDAAGNVGAAGALSVFVTAPGAVTATRVDVIDNNALIYWGEPATGSLPVERYEVRKGATWVAGTVIGSNGNSTFAAVFEQQGGVYTYWVSAVDSAGTFGTAASITATINQPPDYVLQANINSTFSGAKINALADQGGLLLPVNTTETWAQHFANNSYATPQAQINAGHPLYIQPGLTSATYTELIDYGTTLPATTIVATLDTTAVSGTVAASCQISTSNTSSTGPWTTAPAGASSTLATNFRWLRVVYTFSGAGGTNLLQVNALNIKLSTKLRSDSGASAVINAATGVFVPFGYAFIDADTPIVQPGGTVPLIAVVDYLDAPNPTGFTVYLYTLAGVKTTGAFSWSVKGY